MVQVQYIVITNSNPHYSCHWLRHSDELGIHFIFKLVFFFILLLSLFFLFCAALKLFDDKLCSFLTFDSFSCFFSLVVEQIEAAGSKKEWEKKSREVDI